MSVQQTLLAAALVVEARGLHRGDEGSDRAHPDTCSVCAVGAINVVTMGAPWITLGTVSDEALELRNACIRVLELRLRTEFTRMRVKELTGWSDRKRTQDVAQTFRDVAAALDQFQATP